jgi:hypothetical protein
MFYVTSSSDNEVNRDIVIRNVTGFYSEHTMGTKIANRGPRCTHRNFLPLSLPAKVMTHPKGLLIYEGESVNRSQMDITRKTCYIRTWKKKHLFLAISSTNIDTLAPSLYQCVETRNIEVF